MTTVLWLLYLADLVTSISVICLIVGIVVICVWLWRWLHNDMEGDYDESSRPPLKGLWLALALLIVAGIMPSSRTVYAIAAVQAGNTFSTTERGAKVLKALDVWLDKQSKD